MDKKNKKYKDDYSLRTLAYYQREGGIYNELITILQRIRAEIGGRKLLAPNKILNIASDAFEMYMSHCQDEETKAIFDCGFDEMAWELYGGCVAGPLGGLEEKDELVILCTLCVLLASYPEFLEMSIPDLAQIIQEREPSLYDSFWPLINRELENNDSKLESLRNQLSMKDVIIRDKDSQIADLSSRNSELERKIATIEPVYDAYVENIVESSDFNHYLTLDSVLGWISKRKHYKLADQVITMLKDLGRKTATDDELSKIDSVEDELLSKYSETSIVNNNMGIGSNFLTGLAQNPMMPFGVTPEQLTQRFIEFINNGTRRESKD